MTSNNGTPAIRFAGFTDTWEQRKLESVCSLQGGNAWKSSDYTENGTHLVVTIANVSGDVKINDTVGKYINAPETSEYTLNENDILISLTGNVGRVSRMSKTQAVLNQRVARVLFKDENICNSYVFSVLHNPVFEQAMIDAGQGAAQKNIKNSDVTNYVYSTPKSYVEQTKIGRIFESFDTLITLHQRKYDQLVNIKKSMLEKMFPKNGELVPEVRFAGFTGPWERRKFNDLVLIERGGSPRPIDAFITDRPDGLNWIKIGDAPAHGKYITKTEEKISPEGLSKTRVVQPGDLILSNSMSFGRPYIMGITGCIHDGWLLIRNTKEVFDLIFLCHLLGSGQMLEQYGTLAAGSTVNNLNKELVGSVIVNYPTIEEQRKIGAYLEQIDTLITLHQRKLEKLKNIKKAMLERMFV